MSKLPLSRFTVIDLTRARSGPTAVRQLADWGAEVFKIESPGDESDIGSRHGSDFQNLHRNKRSLTLNLKDSDGIAILKRLAERADVLVENYRPDVKHRLGIDYETLHAINPRLVYASISGFGQDGPIPRPAGLRSNRAGDGRSDVDYRTARTGAGARRGRDSRSHRGSFLCDGHPDRAARA